jgi:EAL domain-containing protein (putative c-di-GMP-specific phosphodiesterase class I)
MIVNTLHQYPDSNLAMNVSATTATDPRWYNQLLEIIQANSMVANRLTVEITETVALNDIAATRHFVESLRSAGCKVAIDDFGAGYTSFRNLRDLQVDMIKLDGSFCSNLKNNPENEYFVRSLIDMGRKFNLKTVAEWIEHEEDATLLADWGIDYLQGHLIGQASIVPPWAKGEQSLFSMSANSVPEIALPTEIELVQTIALESESFPAEFVEEIELLLIEEPVTIVTADPQEQEQMPAIEFPELELDLNFDGIEESISALKQTLENLRTEVPAEESTRDAA